MEGIVLTPLGWSLTFPRTEVFDIMIYFVSGGSASGKSALAEKICTDLGGRRIYIATMPVFSDEDRRKVERHHALRAGRGFETFEMPNKLSPVPEEATVLFECLSTFTANRMFSGESSDFWPDKLWKELSMILNRPGHTVVVSADVSFDGIQYDPLTENYRQVLAELGCRICKRADTVVETVCGIPLVRKGSL